MHLRVWPTIMGALLLYHVLLETHCGHCTYLTGPRKPICGKLAFPKLVPLSAKWSLGSLCLAWQIGSLAHSQSSVTCHFSPVGNCNPSSSSGTPAMNDTRTPVVEGKKGIFISDQAVGVS